MKKGLKTGRLFEPKSQSFNAESIDKHKRLGSVKYWIGINAKRGSWAYTSSRLKLEFQNWGPGQRYTYRVLKTIQMKLILLCVRAEPAVLGRTKTALKLKYEI